MACRFVWRRRERTKLCVLGDVRVAGCIDQWRVDGIQAEDLQNERALLGS
jgi:hypothetical protein